MLSEGGADIKLMDRISLESLLPSFNFKDIDVELYSPSDSRIDPYSALLGCKRAAIDLGVEYRKDRVIDINHDHRRVKSVKLESGTFIPVDIIVNAANCWAPDICKMVGMKVPIEPVRRQTFYFESSFLVRFASTTKPQREAQKHLLEDGSLNIAGVFQ